MKRQKLESDLVFTSQRTLIIKSGVRSSLHPNYHHKIVHVKFNLKIFHPPPYEKNFWHDQDPNKDLVERFVSQFNRESALSNKWLNKQISIFNETFLTIMTNFIPHKTKIFKNREPPWINNKVKTIIQEKNKTFQFYFKN